VAQTDGPERVRAVSLKEISDLFLGREIGILKLDIEGAELQIFQKAADILENIPVIFVELHERIAPGCNSAFYEFSRNREVRNIGGEKMLSLTPHHGSSGSRL
jgi:hypothetical protein